MQEHWEGLLHQVLQTLLLESAIHSLLLFSSPAFLSQNLGTKHQSVPLQPLVLPKRAVSGLLRICVVTGAEKAVGKKRGESVHQMLDLQPKVTILGGGRGSVVHTAIQKVVFVPGSSVWQGNKVNVKTTGRHIPQ